MLYLIMLSFWLVSDSHIFFYMQEMNARMRNSITIIVIYNYTHHTIFKNWKTEEEPETWSRNETVMKHKHKTEIWRIENILFFDFEVRNLKISTRESGSQNTVRRFGQLYNFFCDKIRCQYIDSAIGNLYDRKKKPFHNNIYHIDMYLFLKLYLLPKPKEIIFIKHHYLISASVWLAHHALGMRHNCVDSCHVSIISVNVTKKWREMTLVCLISVILTTASDWPYFDMEIESSDTDFRDRVVQTCLILFQHA